MIESAAQRRADEIEVQAKAYALALSDPKKLNEAFRKGADARERPQADTPSGGDFARDWTWE